MEAALVNGLIAQIEGELLRVDDLAGSEVEAGLLKLESPMAQPMVLGHGLDEGFFGGSCGLVLLLELGQELVELGLRFGRQHPEFAEGGEAVTEVVARGSGFSGLRFRAGGQLCIGPIGGELRWCRHAQSLPDGVRREGV